MNLGPFRLLLIALGLALAAPAASRNLQDMGGHEVVLPEKASRIVTLGAVPVLNGFLFAFGAQKAIANGLPRNLNWKYQAVFAPDLAGKPVVQGADGVSIEQVIALQPELILTFDEKIDATLNKLNLPVVQLSWSKPDDVKPLMALLGQILNQPDVAEDYARYFDTTLADVTATLAKNGPSEAPRVLYVNYRSLTQPHRIAEWWIPKAGGRSMTNDGRPQESVTFSLEQIVAWDPQIVIVSGQSEIAQVLAETKLQNVAAVRDKKIFVAPVGAHLWANRTIEQPLTVLWAASLFHPDLFSRERLRSEMGRFYDHFFHVAVTPEQIDEILAGAPGR